MAILPLVAGPDAAAALRDLSPDAVIAFPPSVVFAPGAELDLLVADRGSERGVQVALAVETQAECDILARGGMLPALLEQLGATTGEVAA